MMNVVNRILNRKSETKYVTSRPADANPFTYTQINSTISGSGQWGSALPSLAQGTTDYTRIGDSIVPVSSKLTVEARIRPLAGTTSYGAPVDITLVVFYGYCKKYKQYGDVQSNAAALCTQLLKLGGVDPVTGLETTNFSGNAADDMLVINDETWHLRKKRFHLFKAPGQLNGTTGAGVLSTPDKNMARFTLDFTKMLPAKLRYDDATSALPDNIAPVWTMGYYYNDSTPPDTTAGSGIVEYKSIRHLKFKDM